MRKCWLLMKVQLLGLFGLNKLRYAGTRAERRRMWMIGASVLLVGVLLEAYLVLMALGFISLGMGHLLPSLLLMIAAIITLVFTFIKCNGTLFGFRDYDRVMSLPVSSAVVIASRLLTIYASNTLFSCLAMAPGLIIYGVHAGAAFSYWAMAVLLLVLAPLLPMIVGTLLGAVITAIAVRFRHKNVLTAVLSIAAVVGLMAALMSASPTDLAGIVDLGNSLSRGIVGIYPVAGLVENALLQSDWPAFLLFAALSLFPAFLFVWALSKFYTGIHAALFAHHTHSGYKLIKPNERSKEFALYQKELRRLLASPVYLLNTCIGAVLMVLAAVALLFTDGGQMQTIFKDMGISGVSGATLPAFLCIFTAMSSTTCVSMNMEGKARWIIFAAPLSTHTVFRAKILVNLTILLPAVLIAGIFCIIAVDATFWQGLLMLLLPSAYACFIAVIGLAINLKFPKYDWESEQQAVKQSLSMGVTIGIGFLTCIPLIALTLLAPRHATLLQFAVLLVMGLLTWLFIRRLSKVRLYLA